MADTHTDMQKSYLSSDGLVLRLVVGGFPLSSPALTYMGTAMDLATARVVWGWPYPVAFYGSIASGSAHERSVEFLGLTADSGPCRGETHGLNGTEQRAWRYFSIITEYNQAKVRNALNGNGCPKPDYSDERLCKDSLQFIQGQMGQMIFCVCPMSGTTPLTAGCLMWMEFWVSLVLYDTVKSRRTRCLFYRDERHRMFIQIKEFKSGSVVQQISFLSSSCLDTR